MWNRGAEAVVRGEDPGSRGVEAPGAKYSGAACYVVPVVVEGGGPVARGMVTTTVALPIYVSGVRS